MQELYNDFINWIQSVGLSDIFNILSTVFVAVFVPISNKLTTRAKVDAITSVAEKRVITENYDKNQKQTSDEIKELKETIKELQSNGEKTQQLLEKFGGIIALLINNAKTTNETKNFALKLFKIPTEKIEKSEDTKKTTHELVEEIVNNVSEEVKVKVEKEQNGQFDTLVDDLISNYGK